jgi:hypothetical protein
MGGKRFRWIALGALALAVLVVNGTIQSKEDKADSGPPRQFLWLGYEELFGALERPPVPFDHDGHTKALRELDCDACHRLEKEVEGEKLRIYQFPKGRESDVASLVMEDYHTACMSCHKEQLKAGKQGGPTTCGECHLQTRLQGAPWESMAYDYAIHNKHRQALESKCELCHHIYDEQKKELVYKKGAESSCRDCHGARDENHRRSFRNVAHAQCLDCHMKRSKDGLAAGPTTCAGCHGERERMAIAEMAKLPRLFRDQKGQVLLQIENGRMKATPYDHLAHEGRVRFCRDCHHATQKACSTCHTLEGSHDGAGITLETALHDPKAAFSCQGCHEIQKRASDCLGCHLYEDKGAAEHSCKVCHSATWELPRPACLAQLMEELPEEKVPGKVEIKILAKEYDPAVMPHKKIVKRLLEMTKDNKLADRFHGSSPAICLGCHHESPWDLEAKPPTCKSCHGIIRTKRTLDRPGLLGAYHRQCMGCHEEMNIKAMGCTDCHKQKTYFAQLYARSVGR